MVLTVCYILLLSAVFVFLIYRCTRNDEHRLSAGQIALAFGVKVLAGCAYGLVFLHFFGGDDTWGFHRQSLEEYSKLMHTPGVFFRDLLPYSAIAGASHADQVIPFYIMDLENALLPKLLAIFNIFSRGNYYVNVVFFNALVFWGPYILYRYIVSRYRVQRSLLFALIFLVPPIVFWLSGIRADGLLLLFLALAWVSFQRILEHRRRGAYFILAAALLGILIFRDELLFLLLPALLGWALAHRKPAKSLTRFLLLYGACLLLFFGTAWVSPARNLPNLVVARQQAFFALHGNTRYQLDSLQASPRRFLVLLPQAVGNTFFRPFVWEARGPLQWFTALEVIGFWCFAVWCLYGIRRRRPLPAISPSIMAMLFFSVSLYIFIGYAVPFPGAIVRYKIIAELFLLLVLYLASGRNRINYF